MALSILTLLYNDEMMNQPSYKLSIGSTSIGSAKDPLSGRLVSLLVEKGMDTPADKFEIVLGAPDGINLKKKDKVAVELGYSDKLTKVFDGSVDRVIPNFTSITIDGVSPFSNLLSQRKNETRLNQKSGDIVSYLAKEAGVDVANAEDGFEIPYYVIDSRKNAYEHCITLAKKNGFDLYCNEEGKLVFKKFAKDKADHTFMYASDILSIQVFFSDPLYEGTEVYGESPVSSKGSDTWCWFIKDFSPNKGIQGDKSKAVLIQDPIIRTKDAAGAYASAKLTALKKASVFGLAAIPGNPKVKLGDAVEFKDCPQSELNQVFQMRRIRHLLNKSSGFITEISFCGIDSKET